MTDASFNLAMAAKVGDSWYQHLGAVEAAMAEEDRIAGIRWRAGWTADEGGWYSPCGMHESDCLQLQPVRGGEPNSGTPSRGRNGHL